MPYIITTSQPVNTQWDKLSRARGEGVTRHAVATLDEAVLAARTATDLQSLAMGDIVGDQITESGGTVGPLPDGTVIEVEAMDWGPFNALLPLKDRCAPYGPRTKDESLDAYNTRSRAVA